MCQRRPKENKKQNPSTDNDVFRTLIKEWPNATDQK